jgi:tetratricopeptide (TPR) repeat protein
MEVQETVIDPTHDEDDPASEDLAAREGEPTPDVAAESGSDADGGARFAGDPVVRTLILAIFGVLILFLVAIVSAMLFGFLRPPLAPRTLLERELTTYGEDVAKGTADAKTWANYVAALIDAGQLSKAKTTLAAALASAKTDTSYILVQQARLQFSSGDYAACVKSCDAALAAAESEQKARLDALKAKGIRQPAANELPASWLEAAHLKGDTLALMNDVPAALKAYDRYLEVSPRDSDMLVARGLLRAKSGDKAGAEKDFREALKYIPGYQPALDGLKQIGAPK